MQAAMDKPKPTYLNGVKNIIVVLSGKGGVGKSTVACQLAFALAGSGKNVGILDVDICGPSVPKILGVEHKNVVQGQNGWIPVSATVEGESVGSLTVMSLAFLLGGPNDAVVWRGPRKDAMIKQFVTAVEWGDLDYLIVDTPPGTSDEHMTLCEALMPLDPTGAVVVTTPQKVAVDDVKKELSFCAKLKLRCLGIVENMSGYVCPHCAECTAIFSKGGGEKLAKQYEVPFLGAIPIDPRISICEDAGKSFIESYKVQEEKLEAQAEAKAQDGDDATASGEKKPAVPAEGGAVAAVMAVIENIGQQVKRVEALKKKPIHIGVPKAADE